MTEEPNYLRLRTSSHSLTWCCLTRNSFEGSFKFELEGTGAGAAADASDASTALGVTVSFLEELLTTETVDEAERTETSLVCLLSE